MIVVLKACCLSDTRATSPRLVSVRSLRLVSLLPCQTLVKGEERGIVVTEEKTPILDVG